MKYNDNGTYKDIYVKTFDTLPIGAELDYDGERVPKGYVQVNDKIVLYEDTTGTNSDVLLSDNASNYNYLEIYYGDSDDDYKLCYKCFNANGKQIILSMNAPTTTALYINTSRYTINGTSIEFMNAIQIQILPGKTIGNYTHKDTTAYSYIRKVIGYK